MRAKWRFKKRENIINVYWVFKRNSNYFERFRHFKRIVIPPCIYWKFGLKNYFSFFNNAHRQNKIRTL